jgi:predicted nucleotidyltransferase
MNLQRKFKDRDFIKTIDGFFFCVIGYTHPFDRVISYLRYFPSPKGKWRKLETSYARAMNSYNVPNLLENIKMLSTSFSSYVFHSDIMNVKISAVPQSYIEEYYCPEKKTIDIFNRRDLDLLQETALELISLLSKESNIPLKYFGVTGSILIDIHNPDFSDIDIIIYGKRNSLKLIETLESLFKGTDDISKLSGKSLEDWCNEKAQGYPVTPIEARKFYDRKWSYGLFKEKNFSIHPVMLDREITENYEDKIFYPKGMVKVRAIVEDLSEGLFLPHKFALTDIKVGKGEDVKDIKEIVSYEGFFGDILRDGETIISEGKLEKVFVKKTEECYHRILIGSPEAKGKDYIKPIDLK